MRARALKHSPIDRYLEAAHLAILAGSSLFVHGGITARSAGFLPHAADTDRRLPVTDWVLLCPLGVVANRLSKLSVLYGYSME